MGARVVQLPAPDAGRSFAAMVAQAERDMAALGLSLPSSRRPTVPVFVLDRANRCPDCHGEAFNVGRVTAECAGCGLPLVIVTLRRPL